MDVQPFFHRQSGTLTYLISVGSEAALIDSVLDYDNGVIRYNSADDIINVLKNKRLSLCYILETHIHADHLSAAHYIKCKLGGRIAVCKKIVQIFEHWKNRLEQKSLASFDLLLGSGSQLPLGNMVIEVLETPGHTSDSITYQIGEYLFVGDTLFAPKRGTSRVDFPGGSARELYHSIETLYQYPEEYHVQLCHDYPDSSEVPLLNLTIRDEKRMNVMVNSEATEHEYIERRLKRDADLSLPRIINIAVPYNLTHQLPKH